MEKDEKQKKILHIIPNLSIGGAERLLLNTLQVLPEYEHHIVAFGADPEFCKEFEKVAIVHLKESRPVLTLSNLLFLRELEKEVQPVIIHSHLMKTNWLSRFAFRRHRNLFNSIHSPYGKDAFQFSRFAYWMEKYTYLYSNAELMFVSDYVKEDYNSFIPITKNNNVLRNFVTDEYFEKQPQPYTPGTPLRLVAVGNIKPLKNYGLLVATFKRLKDLPVSLDIYGAGELMDDLQAEAGRHSLPVFFKGGIASIANVLPLYHALVFPSLYEGFSIALLEAMSARMPLILSEIPMFHNLASNRAYYFNPESVEECEAAIRRFYR
jgi:glycosyltransferase involved in cell wall biosynthesis